MADFGKSFYVGIDVGGTFTDCVLVDSNGRSVVEKAFTTPRDPSQGVLNGIEKLALKVGLPFGDFIPRIHRIVHGTTITTNAVLTGSGAKTGFITTKGFRDILAMRRGIRENQFNSKTNPPPPLVSRNRTFTVSERVDCEGREVTPLDIAAAKEAIRELKDANVESVAVSFLFSFLNPKHELEVAGLLEKEFPEAYVSLSTQVLPQLRAYERHSTTVLNAYVGPILSRYLSRLAERLKSAGFQGRLLMMQSNGGVMPPETAWRFACRTLLSGPAGGPVAAIFYGERASRKDLITMDMGGGSFAWVDEGGVLHVGPQSAGADPGPICYDRRGEAPTVTDADLVLGYLGVEDFLGGEFPLKLEGAVIEERIAKPLAIDVIAAAEGIHKIVNGTMADAIRLVSIAQGYDPRQCTLVVAGGAGAVHAAAIARELSIRSLLIPREASVFCAAGMLLSDLRHDYVRTFSGELSTIPRAKIAALYEEMSHEAVRTLTEEGMQPKDTIFSYAVDLKYIGQFHEVTVPFAAPAEDLTQLRASFDAQHFKLYGYNLPGQSVEALHWRLTAIGRTERPRFGRAAAEIPAPPKRKKTREVIFDGRKVVTDVYEGSQLNAAAKIQGAAIVEEPTTTIVIPPEWRLNVNEYGDYELSR